jgi:hypothetical protein
MDAVTVPTTGGEYVYKGQNVRVTEVRKRGRGYQVHYQSASGDVGGQARLKDWQRGVQ